MVIDGLPQRGKPALDLLLDCGFAPPHHDTDLPSGQSACIAEEQSVLLDRWQPGHEVEDLGTRVLDAIGLRGDAAQLCIGACQLDSRPVVTVGVDGGVPRDADEPGLDAAVTAPEAAEIGKRPLERVSSEVQRIRVAVPARAQVSIHRKPVLLIKKPKRGRIQPLGFGLGCQGEVLVHHRHPQHDVPPAHAA